MSAWLINGASPESYGLTITRGQFASGFASSVQLSAARDFDAAELFAHDSVVTILRDGSPFFRGKIRAIPKSGSASREAQDYVVEDVWAELERLTYQEPWAIRQPDYVGTIYSPTVVLGMSSAGVRINVGQQIAEVLAFAVDQGLGLQAGTMPTGMMLWPSEATGLSCAAVIRKCLQFYPDWIPWIDHTTNPPTFKVTPRADATALSVAVTDCVDLDVTETQDRVPDGVRIVYLTAGLIDGEVYRTVRIDQFPAVTPGEIVQAAGPGILVTTVELAGMQMQTQKQQVETRDLPEDQAEAKAYLKLKFPNLATLDDSDWDVTEWATVVVPETYTGADPIDPKLERHQGADRSELPRELVRGNIAEWMQKSVGRVAVEFKVEASGSATIEDQKLISGLPPWIIVNATNAITKIYKGVSSFEAAESVPEGVAEAYYNTILASCQFAGSVTTVGEELPAVLGHGRKIDLTGSSISEWSSMAAPIHSISWDLESCQVTRQFGPNPDLAVEDFLQFLRLLNQRPYSAYSFDERTGDTLGDEGGTSARGDSVGGYDQPETIYGAGGGASDPLQFGVTLSEVAGDWKASVRPGWVRFPNAKSDAEKPLEERMPDGMDAIPAPAYDVAAGEAIYCRVVTDIKGAPTAVTIEVAAKDTPSIHYQPEVADEGSVPGDYYYCLAEIETDDDDLKVVQKQTGGPILHVAPLWTGKNIGDGRDILKKRDNAAGTYEFRKLKQLDVDGVGIIKDAGEDLPDQIEFRTIKEKEISGATEPLIRVTLDEAGESVEVWPDGLRTDVPGREGLMKFAGGMLAEYIPDEGGDEGADFDLMYSMMTPTYDGGHVDGFTEADPLPMFYVRKGIIYTAPPADAGTVSTMTMRVFGVSGA